MDSPDQVELKEIEGKFEIAVNQFHPTPDLPIFLRPDFFKLYSPGAGKAFHFQMCAKESAKVIAAAAFYGIEPHRYVSPWRGSFGALFFTDRTLPLAANDFFLDFIETRLQQEGAKEISMVLPPQAYYPARTSVLVNLLLRKGYKLTGHELNYSRVITDEDFLGRVNQGNRKNIRRAAVNIDLAIYLVNVQTGAMRLLFNDPDRADFEARPLVARRRPRSLRENPTVARQGYSAQLFCSSVFHSRESRTAQRGRWVRLIEGWIRRK